MRLPAKRQRGVVISERDYVDAMKAIEAATISGASVRGITAVEINGTVFYQIFAMTDLKMTGDEFVAFRDRVSTAMNTLKAMRVGTA